MITVNPNTRQFNIPGTDLVFGVEDDSGSVIKQFQVPRYVGNNLDLTGCFIRMNYRNANGEIDTYLVQDVAVEGDNIVFGWELSPRVTMYKGNVSFVMCVVGPDTKVKWHTTLGRGQVLEGLEPDSAMVEEGTADVVATLIAMVEAQTAAVEAEGANQIEAVQTAASEAQATAVAQIEAKGASTLATIPEEYNAVQNAVLNAANAIRGKVSGEVIRVDDVSPMEHYPVVKVHGKNLIPFPYLQSESNTYNGMLIAQADGGISGSGVPTGNASLALYSNVPIVESGEITFSLSGVYTNMIGVLVLEDSNGETLYNKTVEPSLTVNMSDYPSVAKMQLVVKRKSNNIEMTGVVYPQLEIGSSATEYAPYIDPTTVTVRRSGKNLLSVENLALTQSNGVGTVEGDVLTLNGYILSYRFRATGLAGKTVTFSCESTRSGENGGGLSMECRNADNVRMTSVYKQDELSPTVSLVVANGTADILLFFYASRSTSETGTAVYRNIQLEIGGEKTHYEAHNGETQIPSVDGTVTGIKSASPTMTLLTDTAGVTIDCEYSRDTNKVIAEILEKITALGG